MTPLVRKNTFARGQFVFRLEPPKLASCQFSLVTNSEVRQLSSFCDLKICVKVLPYIVIHTFMHKVEEEESLN